MKAQTESNSLQSDQQLVQNVLNGDRQVYAQLVERYQHAVFAMAMRVLRDRDAAADAAQNTFVAAYEKLASLRSGRAFGAWLLVIAHREALAVANARPRMVPLSDAVDRPIEPCGDRIETDEKLVLMNSALYRLPSHERQVLFLRYFDDYPVAAIAIITSRSTSTVTKQISRALERLRKLLKGVSS